jgi:hypothetical protein
MAKCVDCGEFFREAEDTGGYTALHEFVCHQCGRRRRATLAQGASQIPDRLLWKLQTGREVDWSQYPHEFRAWWDRRQALKSDTIPF